jgi:hypothetical protein
MTVVETVRSPIDTPGHLQRGEWSTTLAAASR